VDNPEQNQTSKKGPDSTLFHLAIPTLLFSCLVWWLFYQPLPWSFQIAWVPSLNIGFSVFVDGLSAQFLLMISGIGCLVFLYGTGYLAGHKKANHVFLLLLLFMLAMIGAVVSDNLIVLFVFWELTSVLSFLLVGFNHEEENNRKSAQQAMLITGSGGLCLLLGCILLGQIAGTYSIQLLIARAPLFINDPRLFWALGFVFIGAFTKSAQFPFHFWLPNAMAAPTPVSAYLHSATMVKLGIYLLARLDPAFSDLFFWEVSLITVGIFTAVIAAIQTIYERDLKRILAWSTIATLGTLVMLVGMPGEGAALATAALFFAHALYKAPLFFVAGNLDHGAGTRQIDCLTGMRRYMPWTATAAFFAAISMAGLPLTFGFVAKDIINLAKSQANLLQLVSYAAFFVNVVSVAVAAIAAIHIFWGQDTIPRKAQPHEANLRMLFPPLVLAATGLLFGLRPALIDPLLGLAAQSMAPGLDPNKVDLSYDAIPVIEATFGTLALGLFTYLRWDWLHNKFNRLQAIQKRGPESWYNAVLETLPLVAVRSTRVFQNGMLPRYLLTLIATVAALLATLLAASGLNLQWPEMESLTFPVLGASMVIAAGALATFRVSDHLILLLVGGMVGYGSALLFLFTGAPDLALTQFVVETIFVVVVAAVLVKLRSFRNETAKVPPEKRFRPLHFLVAASFGSVFVILCLLVSALPFDPALTDFYGARSLLDANGRNVVNIILVDFRALDTLGEISVLGFGLLAAYPLLKQIREKRR